jgi:murein DD-endopeptidase MepM/ murein hydrolase activator NlpD
MKDKKFRLLYFPENRSEMREVIVSRYRLMMIGISLICFLFITMTGLGVLFSTYTGDERLTALSSENQILKTQISDMNERMAAVSKDIERIRAKDSELRLVSNLPDVEEMLKDAGIGGSDFKIDYNSDLVSGEADELIHRNLANLEKLETSMKLELQSYADLQNQISTNVKRLSFIPSICPLKTGRVTDRFGARQAFRSWKAHTGLDIAARWGTPVYVTADGVVESVTWRSGYGKSIIVDHGNGFKTLYGHLSAYKCRTGQKVRRNDKIAEVGSTGLSTGPHLHYEVRVNNICQNPELYIFFDMVNYLDVK